MITLLRFRPIRYALLAGFLGLLLLGLYLLWRAHSGLSPVPVRSPIASGAVLPPTDKEQIIVDPRRHTIEIRRPGKDVTTTLPDRPSVIDVRKDGSVQVTAPQFGLEMRPYIGLGFSDDARIALGVDGLYWKRLDLSGGIQLNFHMASPRVFVGLSYLLVDNLRVSVTLDHKKAVGAFLSLRI